MNKKNTFDGILKGAVKQKETQENNAKMQILVDQELQSWIPPLSEAEYEQLKQNILANGCLEALVLWKKDDTYTLVDGHNRYQICKDLGIDFQTKTLEFEDKDAVKMYMLNIQMGRRNLTSEQLSYLRGKRYAQEKSKIRNQLGINGKVWFEDKMSSNQNDDQNSENLVRGQNVLKPERTADRLGREYKVSEKTIKRDEQFAEVIDKIGLQQAELKNNILAGKVKINKNQIQALAKMESFPKIESLDQIADILQTDKPVKEKSKTDLEIIKEKIAKIVQAKNLSTEDKQELKEFLDQMIVI